MHALPPPGLRSRASVAANAPPSAPHASLAEELARTWELFRELFRFLPGDERDGDDLRRARQGLRAHARRRALLARHLAARAAAGAAADARAASGPEERALALLTAGALGPAAGALAAGGFPRLAAVVAGAGSHAALRREAAVQVAAWERGGAASAGLVPAPALALWRLAAGDVLSAVRALGPFLPWPRLLALHLWFAVDAASPLAAAVEALEATLRDLGIDRHPHPWYAHAQAHGEALPPAAAAMASVAPRRRIYDTAFELLRAATGQLPAPAGRRGACAPLARVLRPPGATPDRLDYAQAWCLMGLARAGGCLPEILGGGAGAWEAARVCLGLVGQLEACGGDLAPWAAWVAACIPDDAATPEQRAALVEVSAGLTWQRQCV